jgi:hypothetical protein
VRKKLYIALIAIAALLVGVVCFHTLRTTSARDRAMHPEWPLTVDDAVTKILAQMSESDKAAVKTKKKSELIQYHMSWGMGIRNSFGLWGGNRSLLADCHAYHPDDASMVIMEAVWQKLQTK